MCEIAIKKGSFCDESFFVTGKSPTCSFRCNANRQRGPNRRCGEKKWLERPGGGRRTLGRPRLRKHTQGHSLVRCFGFKSCVSCRFAFLIHFKRSASRVVSANQKSSNATERAFCKIFHAKLNSGEDLKNLRKQKTNNMAGKGASKRCLALWN